MKRILLALITMVSLQAAPSYSLELFGSSFINEQLNWIRHEIETSDLKSISLEKIEALQKGIESVEADLVKKIKKTESKLQKYSNKLNEVKEDKEVKKCMQNIKSLEEELLNFNEIQQVIDEIKAKLQIATAN